MSDIQGEEEGHVCNRQGCCGIMSYVRNGDCSCHISPPCSACVNSILTCDDCGEIFDPSPPPPEPPSVRKVDISWIWNPRSWKDLDSTKIDWFHESHSHCSMKKLGVYPEGTTQEEVRKIVDGTFGGRFERFGHGEFVFIAYTD